MDETREERRLWNYFVTYLGLQTSVLYYNVVNMHVAINLASEMDLVKCM